MHALRRDLIESIHKSSAQLSACICGAGSSAISSLTKVAGCTKTLIYAETIYSFPAIDRALGGIPKNVVSESVAQQLAQRAFLHSQVLTKPVGDDSPASVFLMGVGATSAVQTNFTRATKDRVHLCIWSTHVNHQLGGKNADPYHEKEPLHQANSRVRVQNFYAEPPQEWDRYQQDDYIELFILYNIANVILEECGSSGELDSILRVLASPSFLAGLGPATSSPLLLSVAPISNHSISAIDPITEALEFVLNGKTKRVIFNAFGEIRCDVAPYTLEEHFKLEVSPTPSTNAVDLCEQKKVVRLVYPGSFRPLHYGHTELARAALRALTRGEPEEKEGGARARTQVTYEIAVSILDKGNVSCEDLTSRVRQFLQHGDRIAVTNASRFTEKALLFPGHGFIVGVDTARRILDPQYYEECDVVKALLEGVGERGCYFVVGGRTVAKKEPGKEESSMVWEDLYSLEIPEALRHLFIGLRENEFHIDISSTELRARQGKA
ncbi:unnamed protein product [Phytomonas sp. EM1]|nr:unnamed protein product [Phytomonas sp. EM1]|eukprot:CCW59823.1 unnamed protein product [Phytomonas sp. isolate EM1]